MHFVKVDVTDIPNNYRGDRLRSDNYKLLMEFYESTCEVAEVKDYTQKSARVCQISLQNSARRYHLDSIVVIVRGDRVFLMRKIIR